MVRVCENNIIFLCVCLLSVYLSVTLSPPKQLGGIQPNLLHHFPAWSTLFFYASMRPCIHHSSVCLLSYLLLNHWHIKFCFLGKSIINLFSAELAKRVLNVKQQNSTKLATSLPLMVVVGEQHYFSVQCFCASLVHLSVRHAISS